MSSFTEAANPISSNIDVAPPEKQAWTLRQADMLMLQGWEGHPGLASRAMIKSLAAASIKAGEALSKGGGVILSGAGSSGRLAAHAAAAFNRLLPPSVPGKFMYTIAGGDGAIVKSAEALEDSPSAALHDLGLAIDSLPPHPAHGRPPCVLVGVTCGMSATYVGSQLESALADPNIFPVLVGFNPVERARDVVIPSWGKSFKDFALVLAKAHDDGDACLLNPVVGPEVVTGSTRMKSGSATKIILEIICSTAIACASASPAAAVSPVDAERSVSELINLYSNVIAATYTSTELSLPPLISKSSHSLRSSSPQSPSSAPPSAGRILYASDVTCAGMALLDASECPPTYGASFNQVRAFCDGGWSSVGNASGDLSGMGEAYNCSLGRLVELIEQREPVPPPTLLVIVRAGRGDMSDGLKAVVAAAAAAASGNHDAISVCNVHVAYDGDTPSACALDGSILCTLPASCNAPRLGAGPLQLAVKLILNAVSTCAFVNLGCVYGNRMVNLTVSNDKLFSRAVSIVASITSAAPAAALHALLRSLYDRDGTTDDLQQQPVAQHVARGSAKQGQRAVPVAIMLAMDEALSAAQAQRALQAEPRVRAAIEAAVKGRAA